MRLRRPTPTQASAPGIMPVPDSSMIDSQGSYATFAPWYDKIMESGYYDYSKIASELCDHVMRTHPRSVLEIGVGTGLIIKHWMTEHAHSAEHREISGIDLTPEMLAIAARRLRHWGITLIEQNALDLDLGTTFDLAYSYGGVWYFVPATSLEGETSWTMISHLRTDEDNRRAFVRLGEHVAQPHGRSRGMLLLGVQAPHTSYVQPLPADPTGPAGFLYGQVIEPLPDGFRKHYTLNRIDPASAGGAIQMPPVMAQTTYYRTYTWAEALDLLAIGGFEPARGQAARGIGASRLFLAFTRR